METFLLLVVIVLLIIFHVNKNNKLIVLEAKLKQLENLLKNQSVFQNQSVTKTSSEFNDQKVVNTEVKPIVEPVIPKVETIVLVIEPIIEPTIETIKVKEEAVVTQQSSVNIIQPIPPKPKVSVQPKLSWYDNFRKNNPDIEKFIGENVISKIGIAIFVIGIAFFVKFAIDKEWINEIARVGIGVLTGAIVLGIAHRLRLQFKAFSSVLVAGGIAIFYFTIGIAFHQYHIFNQSIAFVLMAVITLFSIVISIAYNRQELAVLSLIGGFAVPFMLSTGQGNYQVLFTYILILDIGMLVIAYLRKWNLINILSYVFTIFLYTGWLEAKVIHEPNAPYKGALVFAGIFYVVFVLMNIINNIKEKQKFGAFELSILISNTFIFYGLGMQILSVYHPELQGLYSILMGLFNFVCAWLLYKKFKADLKLVYLMIGLTLTFVTISAPVQLHGNYITLFWALEAVLLMWLAQKSNIVLYRFVSIIVSVLMLFSLLMDWTQIYIEHHEIDRTVMLNKAFITGFVSALSCLAIVLLLKKETEKSTYLSITFNPVNYSKVLKIGFIALLYFSGLFELIFQLNKTLDYASTITIIVCAYHLIFFTCLNVFVIVSKLENLKLLMYIFNFINVTLFVLIFAVVPLVDFRENILSGLPSPVGFIFHYISLACIVYTITLMYKAIKEKESRIKFNPVLNSVLFSIAIVYVLSIELLLHVNMITISPVTSLLDTPVLDKMDEISSVKIHTSKIGFPILWGVLAFLFLFFGMKKVNKTMRILALVLLGITLAKLFTYDIKDASEAGKIIAFIILGIVLLIISFMYQKIKALLLSDLPKEEVKEENETPPTI